MIKIKIPDSLTKPKVKILKVISKTASGRHYWCEAIVKKVTFMVRKPVGSIKNLLIN